MYKVYGKNWCPYCDKTKDELERLGHEYVYHNIENDDELRKYVVEILGFKKVPQIFKDEQHVGGYEDLIVHLNNDFENLF